MLRQWHCSSGTARACAGLMPLPVVILRAGWLMSARSAIVLCAATVLFGLALALGEQAGLLPLYVSPSPPLLVWLAFSTYIVPVSYTHLTLPTSDLV